MDQQQRPAVIAAVPTPFTADGGVDWASTGRLLEALSASRLDALMMAGTTGEFPALSDGERVQLFRLAVEAAGPDRVIAHVGAASAHQAVALTSAALAVGVTRLAALTPYYLPASPAGVRSYFEAVSRAAAGASIYAYLFPALSGTTVTPSEITEIAAALGLTGVKLSIPGTDFVAEVARLSPRTEIFSGNDALVAAVQAAGGHGVISGVSPSAPEAFLGLAEAVATGSAELDERQGVVDSLVAALGPRVSLGKTALVERGLIADATCRMSIDPPTAEERAAISTALLAAAT